MKSSTRPRARRDTSIRRPPPGGAPRCAHVRKFGDPVLRSKARAVDRFDDELRDEIARMGVLMHDAYGIGLAATQVGILHRVLVYRVEPDSPVNALVNPEIEWSSKDKEWAEEGCLSLPAVHVDVERPVYVRVKAQDETGEEILVEASGLEARVIQHEMDHLDGVADPRPRPARPAQGGHARPARRARGRGRRRRRGLAAASSTSAPATSPPASCDALADGAAHGRRSSSRAPTPSRAAAARSARRRSRSPRASWGSTSTSPRRSTTTRRARGSRRWSRRR